MVYGKTLPLHYEFVSLTHKTLYGILEAFLETHPADQYDAENLILYAGNDLEKCGGAEYIRYIFQNVGVA